MRPSRGTGAQYAPAGGGARFTIVSSLTHPLSPRVVQDPLNLLADYLKEKGVSDRPARHHGARVRRRGRRVRSER